MIVFLAPVIFPDLCRLYPAFAKSILRHRLQVTPASILLGGCQPIHLFLAHVLAQIDHALEPTIFIIDSDTALRSSSLMSSYLAIGL